MTLFEKLSDWLIVVIVALGGWLWRMNDRVKSLEVHQEYTHRQLDRIALKLDQLLERHDERH